MGLSNFPGSAEGVLPLLVMNTVLSVALLKNMVRSVLQVIGCATWSTTTTATSSSSSSSTGLSSVEEEDLDIFYSNSSESSISSREIRRRVSITQFKSLCKDWTSATMECCVCLSGFQADEEVSELSCKHFFHKGCLDKWFDNNHTTCPLCRSVL